MHFTSMDLNILLILKEFSQEAATKMLQKFITSIPVSSFAHLQKNAIQSCVKTDGITGQGAGFH